MIGSHRLTARLSAFRACAATCREPVHDTPAVIGADQQKLLLHGRQRAKRGIFVLEEVGASEKLRAVGLGRHVIEHADGAGDRRVEVAAGMTELDVRLIEERFDVHVELRGVGRRDRGQRRARSDPTARTIFGSTRPELVPEDRQTSRRPKDLQRLGRRTSLSDLNDGERRPPHEARRGDEAREGGVLRERGDEAREKVSELSSDGRSIGCRFGRFEPTATSVAVVGAGVAVSGCERLIHQKASAPPATTPASTTTTQRHLDGGAGGSSIGARSAGRSSWKSSKAMGVL